MFNLEKFIGQFVTKREKSLLTEDLRAHVEELKAEIAGKRVWLVVHQGIAAV